MKKIGIGYENYKEFFDNDLYFVDKTLLISDILTKGGKVTLITRPRRFGKTLALSMLRTFFELEYDRDGNVVDNSHYFDDMKIMAEGDEILSHMGKYPVIKMSLKSAKQPDFEGAFLALRDDIIGEFRRHDYLMKSDALDDEEKGRFKEILGGINTWWKKSFKDKGERESAVKVEVKKYATALKWLSEYLKKHHGRGVVILLDEYDVPLENAYYSGFYDQMVGFIRSLFESALKTNDALERAVITGCLRISKESIFTGLNHLNLISIRSGEFAEGFGFTQKETEEMLIYYGLSDKIEEVREWYDGYLFGETEIYNPWSVIKYIYEHRSRRDAFPEPYWSNTSSNSIIKDLVERSNDKGKEELDRLIGGGSVEKVIHEDITYDEIYESDDNLWNFLFFTGYMRKVSERQVGEKIYMKMRIPNREIKSIYGSQISLWFDKRVEKADRSSLYKAIVDKDVESIGDFLDELLSKSISVFDSAESFYHGFFLSLLYGMPRYSVRSNMEEGIGRPDIVLYPNRPRDPAYIFELKAKKHFNEMQKGIDEAFAQIKDKKYEEGILDDGYAGVVSFGICFCKKSCIVELMK